MDNRTKNGFQLGEFRVFPLRGIVEGPAGSTHLAPKAADVLACLARTPGIVVTFEELLDEVWGDSAASHDGLVHAVGEIRAALGDRADDPGFIETVHTRGYCLIAAVSPLSEAGGTAEVDHSADEQDGSPLIALWEALKRRRVVRVSIAYAAIAWVLLQFAEIVFDALAFPDWSMRVFVVVLGAGFLLTVVIAWAYQVVPEATDGHQLPVRGLQRAVDVSIILVLAIGVGLLVYRQFVIKPVFEPIETTVTVPYEAPDEQSVAVMRFENLGGDEQFSDGLADNLLHLLASLGEIKVPSRTTTWKLTDESLGAVEIAKALRVRYVLEGTVQQSEDKMRVVTQLIDGESGNHVWSEVYDHELNAETFFRTQDDIAENVADRIKAKLSADNKARLARPDTASFTALAHYLAGRELLRQPKTDQTLTGAVEAFNRALDEDPAYAQATAGLCEAHLARFVISRADARFAEAERACRRASSLDDQAPEVYAAMGNLYRLAGRQGEAEEMLLKSLALRPDTAATLEELGRNYRMSNKLVLAEDAFQRAIEAEPASWSVYKSMGNFLFRTGRYEDAIPYYRQVTTMEPDSATGYNNLAVSHFMLGQFDDANIIWSHAVQLSPTRLTFVNLANSLYYAGDYAESAEVYEKALAMSDDDYRVWQGLATSLMRVDGEEKRSNEAWARAIDLAEGNLDINPNDAEALSHVSVAYARIGEREFAERALDRVNALGWENPNYTYYVGLCHHLLGRDDDAIRELERAVVMGFPRALIEWDPDFQTLKSNRRYLALLEAGSREAKSSFSE